MYFMISMTTTLTSQSLSGTVPPRANGAILLSVFLEEGHVILPTCTSPHVCIIYMYINDFESLMSHVGGMVKVIFQRK